jgi:hypothetical protein
MKLKINNNEKQEKRKTTLLLLLGRVAKLLKGKCPSFTCGGGVVRTFKVFNPVLRIR